MSMGGGGGSESPMDRVNAAMAAGITDRGMLEGIYNGMTPMSYTNYMNAKNLAIGGKGQPPGAFSDVKKYGLQMADMAKGGLLVRGLKDFQTASKVSATVPGAVERMAARYGVDASKEQGIGGKLNTINQDTASRVGLGNQVRRGLVDAQYGLRFGGISV